MNVVPRRSTVSFILLLIGILVVVSCASKETSQDTGVTSTATAVFNIEKIGTLTPPATIGPPSELSAIEWELNCFGAERRFPPRLDPSATPIADADLLEAWRSYLSDSVIVDSNSRVKSFQIAQDGSGIWTDSELRPVLLGREFRWAVSSADGDSWSDIDLTLSFEDGNYELDLPLRRRAGQILDPTGVEGLIVTEARECGEFVPPENIEPFPERIWQPSPGPAALPLPETISTSARPERLLWADGFMFASNGGSFWVKVDESGEVITEFRAARSTVADSLFDGEFLWFSDKGEGEVRKFDLDGNRLATVNLPSPDGLAFDGENIWVERSDTTTLFKLNRDGERIGELELPSNTGGIEIAGGQLWVGLPDDWSIASYTLDGELLFTSYLQGKSSGIGFDGDSVWVTVPDLDQVRKISLDGEQLLILNFPPRFNPNTVTYDGKAVWLVNPCCSGGDPETPPSYQTDIVRVDLDGVVTGRFQLQYPAGDVEFDGEQLWFSHRIERAFTQLAPDADGPLWTQMIGPYTEEDIVIETPSVVIRGTLTVPEGTGPHPLVIFPPNRNSAGRDVLSFDVKRYQIRADDLARNGFSVFRYDGRGDVGADGDSDSSTVRDIADDLHAVIDALKKLPGVDPEQIGIWGFGAENLFSTLVMSERDDLRFMVGSLLPLGEFLTETTSPQLLNLRFTAESEKEIREYAELYGEAIEIARLGLPWDDFERKVRELENDGRASTSLINSQPFQTLRYLESKNFAAMLDFNATPLLESVIETPYLLMYAGLDLTIPASIYAPRAEEVIARSGNPDAAVVVFEKANAVFMPAISGRFDEIAILPIVYYPSFIRPGVIETGTNWIIERVEFQE